MRAARRSGRNLRSVLDVSEAGRRGVADAEAHFIRQVREAFQKPACVRSVFTVADEKLALNLCLRGVGLDRLRRAIWLGCARKYVAVLNGQTRLPITSLAYFAP